MIDLNHGAVILKRRTMHTLNPIVTADLWNRILEGYALDPTGIHGINHWLKVNENACRLAKSEGVQSDVFALFAVFHDARRLNDSCDPDHGPRGAALARELHGELFDLSKEDLERLCTACERHTAQIHHDDPVIGICFDADRLDLPRVGIATDAHYLNSLSAVSEVLPDRDTSETQHDELEN